MNPFSYVAVTMEGQALGAIREQETPRTKFIAGGTSLIDLMKLGVEKPERLVDINRLPYAAVESTPVGGVRIGANVRNSQLAYHPLILERYPVLSQAILSGASPQLRNMATTAGNLMQRTRCYYFRDTSYPCNKREPGSGCSAIDGFNRIHAVLGASEKCIATHPSDMCVALAALDAVVIAHGAKGERRIPFDEFYVSYGDDPARETTLSPEELIVAVELPPMPWARRSAYMKVRDRASYEFALASAAVALNIDNSTIRDARVALGGIATKPWRAREAEQQLIGAAPSAERFTAASNAALQGAKPQKYNAFKVELARRTLTRALTTVAALA